MLHGGIVAAFVECSVQTSHSVRWAFCRLEAYCVRSDT